MKNIFLPKKKLSNTEYDFNTKIFRKNTKIKEKSKRENSNNDDSENLSSAYNNINVLLSNCIETIRKEEKENENMGNPIFKNVSGLLNKNPISTNKVKKIIKSSFLNISKKTLNKSNSLSNSNTVLLKSPEENFLNSLNIDKDHKKKNIYQKKTSPLKKINKKNTNQSELSHYINIKNAIMDDKIKSFTKRNTIISNNSKLKFSSNKHLINIQKKDGDLSPNKVISSFNIRDIKQKLSIKTKNTKSSLRTNKTIKGKNNKNKKSENNYLSLNYNSNVESFSPKSIKNNKPKRLKKVTFKDKVVKRRKKRLNTFGFNTNKRGLSLEKKSAKNLKSNYSQKSVLSDDKSSKNLVKNNTLKRPKTVIIPFKINENILDSYIKKNTIKSIKPIKPSKKNMKILSLEQIEHNIKQSLIGLNLTEIKKELYELENNDISEVIKNLPTKKYGIDENNNKNNLNLNESNKINKIDLNTSNESKSEESNGNINIHQKKYRKLFLNGKVYDSLDDEELGDEEVDNFFLDPHSFTVYFIDSIIFVCSFIELFYLPFFLGYKKSFCREHLSFESLLFYSIDFLYIIDLITGFFRAYYNFEEFLIRNNIDIIINYLKGWFIYDFFEAIPFYTIFNFNEKQCNKNIIHYLDNVDMYNAYYSLLIVKILKIFKTFNHNKTMDKINDFLNNNDFFSNWNGVFFTLLVLLSLIHFFSCFLIYFGKIIYPGWITVNDIQNNSFSDIYVTAIYYLMTTLTTVGYGDISISTTYERIYQIILLLVGTCAYSWILTFISNYIKKMNEQYIDFENKVKILGEIRISYPLLKNELYEKIIRYLKYNKSENKYNVDYILDSLPLSLKNNVIIDMYKPIIKNFQFFKSFQNSDFFVKIVTSLKSVLSMKDDILIQEGDVIEDIIFIKKGVLSLEINIDLESPQESCEAHLNPKRFIQTLEPQQTMKTGRGVNNSLASSNINYSKHVSKKPNIKSNIKPMTIINLRKNEHYGDILMILNERSPLNVKVKSKKAELFFLQKTEATEISNKYPNIWKRIVRKSLYNMNQIKNLIKKKIIIFCDLNGISINPELKKNVNLDNSEDLNALIEDKKNSNSSKNILNNNKKSKNKNSISSKKPVKNKNQIDSIIYEVDENLESNRNSYIKPDKNKKNSKNYEYRFSNKKERNSDTSNFFSSNNIKSGLKSFLNKTFSNNSFKHNKKHDKRDSLLLFNSNENSNSNSNKKEILSNSLSKEESSIHENEIDNAKESNLSSSNKINKDKNEENENNQNLKSINNKLNKMLTVIEEKIKQNNSHIDNLNINFFTKKTVNYPNNHFNRRFSEPIISIKNNNYNEEDNEINEEIYSDEDFNINIENENVPFNNSDKNNNIIYPYINAFINSKNNNLNEFNLSKLLEKNRSKLSLIRNDAISKNSKISKNTKNYDLIKSSRFSNLYTTASTSFTIYSAYENINRLTGYKYNRDIFLQNKIKNYIIDECFFQTNTMNYLKKINSNLNSPTEKMIKTNQGYSKNSKTSRIGGNSNVLIKNNKNEEQTPKHKKIKMRNSLKSRQKRGFSIDNIGMNNKLPQNHNKSFLDEKNQKYQKYKRRKSTNFWKNPNISFLNYSNISNRHINILQDDNFLNNKRGSRRTLVKLHDDEEVSFYTKMKTIRNIKNTKNDTINNNSFVANSKKYNLMDKISQNIQKNKQNLNNPEEYFSGFFSNILQRKKTITRKQIKATKKSSNYNVSNFNIKRTSTSSEVINRKKNK